MLCENCGENEANVKYTQIINGIKKEMILCKNCADKLGVEHLDFNMPINLSNFFGDFLGEETNLLGQIVPNNTIMCNKCKMTYDDFLNTGKFGCNECYNAFEPQIDSLLKNLQGSNKHLGRKIIENKEQKVNIQKVVNKTNKQIENDNPNKIDILKNDLKQAIKEERYEDAAKIRDEIKKLELGGK